MGRGRPCLCPLCKTTVNKEDAFEYKKKYYHVDCFSSMSRQTTKIEESKQKQKIEKVKDKLQKETSIQPEAEISDEEILAKDVLFDYLKKLLKIPKLNVKTYKLLKDYYTTYKFSYNGMLTTLKYFYELQNNPIVSDCVGIIPYTYAEAQEYEQRKKEITKQANTFDMTEAVTPRVVKIRKQNEINIKLINIDDLR